MALKEILVQVDTSKHVAKRLRYAAELARQNDAHLTGLYALANPIIGPYIGEQMSAEIIQTLMNLAREGGTRAKQAFEAAVAPSGVSREWRIGEGTPEDVVAEHGRYADLIVTGQVDPDEDSPLGGASDLPEAVALNSGRPVLVVPVRGDFSPPPKRILVGWNASRESSRAVHDSMGFLKAAERVEIVAVNPDPLALGPLPGADIAGHLARHGVKANAKRAGGEDADAAHVLLGYAGEMGADLLVMGCYGHSRLREMVLGGATRGMLRQMTVPVLLSH